MVKQTNQRDEEPHFKVQAKSRRTAVVYAKGLPGADPDIFALYAFVSGAAMNKSSLRSKADLDLDDGPCLHAAGWHDLGPLLSQESIARNWEEIQKQPGQRPDYEGMLNEWLDTFKLYDPDTEGRAQFLQRFATLVVNVQLLSGQANANVSMLAQRLGVTRVTIRRWMDEIKERSIAGVAETSYGYRLLITPAIYDEAEEI